MLKIGKGLHKKKKSKKNKHKEEELFTEEELDKYRREHSQKEAATASAAEDDLENNSQEKKTVSEEFEKFKALTAGVDDVLRKSQGDLDRIKKESFFQRKPTPSEIKAQEEKERQQLKQTQGNWIHFEDKKPEAKGEESEHGPEREKEEDKDTEQESEPEFEVDDEEDVFDTTYVEALESGQLKLAYVPEDDELKATGEPDPFDTTTAEEVLKKVQQEEEKKKRQISLGLAVQVLTGRAERDKSLIGDSGASGPLQATTTVTRPKKRPRKIQDVVLIGSFDEDNSHEDPVLQFPGTVLSPPKTLLDNDIKLDCELPEGDALINEVLAKVIKPDNSALNDETETPTNLKDVVTEFDVIKEEFTAEVRKAEEIEDQFDEFTALAASSVANQRLEEELQRFQDFDEDPFDTTTVEVVLKEQRDPFGNIDYKVPPPQIVHLSTSNQKWKAFESTTEIQPDIESDPFDTTFLENIHPGKCELKLLENEILGNILEAAQRSDVHQEARILSRNNSESDQPRSEPGPNPNHQSFRSTVSIQITDPSGLVESQRGSETESRDEDFQSLSYKHRDLLGGSTTDLTKLGNEPLPPETESAIEDFSRYSDPFDTSIVDRVTLPGKAELKFIEKELLADLPKATDNASLSDEEFDPREEETFARKVSFDVVSPLGEGTPSPGTQGIGLRPLTPYRPEGGDSEAEGCDINDPFDTSALNTLPGKEELKIIEKELNSVRITEPGPEHAFRKLGLVESEAGLRHSVPAEDLETIATELSQSSGICGLGRDPGRELKLDLEKKDLLTVEEELPGKALTPQWEEDISSYIDPFDTSIAENILPGKAELKVLENELIVDSKSEGGIKRSYTDPDFDPRDEPVRKEGIEASDILGQEERSELDVKPLTPVDFDKVEESDFDPFDTSVATNLLPGKAEIRILESELFGQ